MQVRMPAWGFPDCVDRQYGRVPLLAFPPTSLLHACTHALARCMHPASSVLSIIGVAPVDGVILHRSQHA